MGKTYNLVTAQRDPNKGVPFMMEGSDFRLSTGDYEVVAQGRYDKRRKRFEANGKVWRVYPDWSLKELEA